MRKILNGESNIADRNLKKTLLFRNFFPRVFWIQIYGKKCEIRKISDVVFNMVDESKETALPFRDFVSQNPNLFKKLKSKKTEEWKFRKQNRIQRSKKPSEIKFENNSKK